MALSAENIKIGISTLSLTHIGWQGDWPQYLAPVDEIIIEAMDAGFDRLQYYPAVGKLSDANPLKVDCYENFWGNPWESLWEAVTHPLVLGLKRILLCDTVAMISPRSKPTERTIKRLENAGAWNVVHRFDEVTSNRAVMEYHSLPALQVRGLDQFIAVCQSLDCWVCVDTLNLICPPDKSEIFAKYPKFAGKIPAGSCEEEWLASARRLAQETKVKVVHVHFDLGDFGIESLMARIAIEVLRNIPEDREIVMIAEYHPPKTAVAKAKLRQEIARSVRWTMGEIVQAAL